MLLLFFTAAAVITICSKCSPLYPLNDWDDPNCFFTVGKAVADGKVMYRDIFEQKGPVLYFLHTLAYYISPRSFLGIYFLEIICAWVFLIFSYKTMLLFCGRRCFAAMPVIAAVCYASYSFQGGDSAEELCLPFISICLWAGLVCATERRPLSYPQCFITGIAIGFVLWVKFTMLGFFIGFAAAVLIMYARRRQYRVILPSVLTVLGGMLAATLPVIIYFARHNAFGNLFEVYFYDNMFLYSTGTETLPVIGKLVNLFIGIGSVAVNNISALIFIICGSVFIIRKKRRGLAFFFFTVLAATFFFVYIGGRFFAYYSLIFCVYAPVGAAGIYSLVRRKYPSLRKKYRGLAAAAVTAAVLSLLLCPNLPRLMYSREDFPQYRFDRIISQKKDATLLNYGCLDGGFYTVSGIVPDCRFFCELNVEYEDMYKQQKEIASSGGVDFIVTRDEELDSDAYECIDTCEFPYSRGISVYRLYRLCSA